ncbi:hypothetical protein [Streptomyces sp. NPDC005485]|uniref:hypothetical protein n=1 Tax=Streptomyces sp. NPDC005485 TaxID=3155591 RepID=UPI0033B297AC
MSRLIGGRGQEMWRWDAHQQRWIDDGNSAGDGAGGDAGSETPWWAAEETRAAGLRPPPPVQQPAAQQPPPPPPVGMPPPVQPPPVQQPWQQPGPWSAPVPGAVPGPANARGGSGQLIAMVVALVLVAGGIGAGVWVLMRRDAADRTASGGSQSSASASASAHAPESPSPSPSASAFASASTLASTPPQTSLAPQPEPAPGYSRAVDPVGYTLDVPDGWLRKQEKGEKAPVVTYYTDPGDSREIELFKVTEDSPADSLDQAENKPWGFRKQLSGYEVLDRTSGPGWAELTYHYDGGEEVGPLLVIDHRFTAPDGTLYAIRVSHYEGATSEDLRGLLTTAVSSFCPTGTDCTGA